MAKIRTAPRSQILKWKSLQLVKLNTFCYGTKIMMSLNTIFSTRTILTCSKLEILLFKYLASLGCSFDENSMQFYVNILFQKSRPRTTQNCHQSQEGTLHAGKGKSTKRHYETGNTWYTTGSDQRFHTSQSSYRLCHEHRQAGMLRFSNNQSRKGEET